MGGVFAGFAIVLERNSTYTTLIRTRCANQHSRESVISVVSDRLVSVLPDACGPAPVVYLNADRGCPLISPSGVLTFNSLSARLSGSSLIALGGMSGRSIALILCRNT